MAIVTPNGPKSTTSGEIKQILNFLKELLPHSTVKAISLLLRPCCIPTIDLSNFTCGWDSIDMYGLSFDITVTDAALANQSLSIVVASTINEPQGEAGVALNITLDNNGSWSGRIKTPVEGCPHPSDYDASFTVYLIASNLHVVHISYPIMVHLPNCC